MVMGGVRRGWLASTVASLALVSASAVPSAAQIVKPPKTPPPAGAYSETLSYRIPSATIRSLPGPDGQPATPIVVARTSRVTAGGVRAVRVEHTILPRPQP